MNQIITKGIVLRRINYQEADRIINLLTEDKGKVTVIAKGVRRQRSKLAGGIELFSVSEISYIKGKSDIHTLVSARLDEHFGNIAKDIDRTMFGYEMLKIIDKVTEDAVEEEYFTLLKLGLHGLNDSDLPLEMLEIWFCIQLLQIMGRAPNFQTGSDGKKLSADKKYDFDIDDMIFSDNTGGEFSDRNIKLFRIAVVAKSPLSLKQVLNSRDLMTANSQLAKKIIAFYS